jgi:hypothetical protein
MVLALSAVTDAKRCGTSENAWKHVQFTTLDSHMSGRHYKHRRRKRNNCIACERSESSRWYQLKHGDLARLSAFIRLTGAKSKVICASCKLNLDPGAASVKRSTIPNAGNGLFAERDYRW